MAAAVNVSRPTPPDRIRLDLIADFRQLAIKATKRARRARLPEARAYAHLIASEALAAVAELEAVTWQ